MWLSSHNRKSSQISLQLRNSMGWVHRGDRSVPLWCSYTTQHPSVCFADKSFLGDMFWIFQLCMAFWSLYGGRAVQVIEQVWGWSHLCLEMGKKCPLPSYTVQSLSKSPPIASPGKECPEVPSWVQPADPSTWPELSKVVSLVVEGLGGAIIIGVLKPGRGHVCL